MKFKEYLDIIADADGFLPTPHLQQTIRRNKRPTAREEAIAAKIIEQANPRENISGRAGWDKEETIVLQQLWIHPQRNVAEWRDVMLLNKHLYSIENTKHGPMPVPNAVREPGTVTMDLHAKIREAIDAIPDE